MPAIHMSPPAPRTHEESISQRGWTVTARKAPIIGSPLLEEYSEALGSVLTLPEILFGNSSLQLRHEASGVVLSFAAFDALKQWKLDNLPPLKVPVAKEWQAARQQEIAQQQAVVLDYDWTYSTSYAGTLACGQPGSGSRSSQAHAAASGSSSISSPSSSDGCNAAMAAAAVAATSICDGGAATAASDAATQQHVPESEQVSPPAEATAAASCQHQHDQQQRQQPQEPPTWQPTSQQIDRGMLMSKSEPILFYAEVPLYESELDDNGVCQLSVKVGGRLKGLSGLCGLVGGWLSGYGSRSCSQICISGRTGSAHVQIG